MIGKILVAADLGPAAENVMTSAGTLARLLGAELHVRHVSESVPGSHLPAAAADAVRRDEELLRVLVERTLPDLRPASVQVLAGGPASAILSAARELTVDMIVLGAHAQHDVTARLVGTTADRVVRESRLPVLIVRAPLSSTPDSVVVPTDFSAAATNATRFAGRWAAALRSAGRSPNVHLLHVDSALDQLPDEEPGPVVPRLAAAEHIFEDSGGGSATSHVVAGDDPAARIREWAEQHAVDLIVMGTTGRTRSAQILLGSVATRVARTAPCPVLLMPPPVPAARRAPALDAIVVGVDFSAASLGAADWAVATLAPTARRVVLHVLEQPDPSEFLSDDDEVRAEHVRELREAAAGHMSKHFASLREEERRIVLGRTAEMLVQVAHEESADVIVVGGHMHPRGLWSTLGSTAERLVHTSDVPVLVAKGRPAGPPTRILAAVDGSRCAAEVLQWTRLFEDRFGADIHIAHVLNSRYIGAARRASGMLVRGRVDRGFERQTQQWLRRLADAAGIGERARLDVVTGEPALELLALQQRLGADCIIIGSHGAGSVASALLGSVSYSVVRGSTCATLVVR